ncbi:unnamed protein product [Rotaria sordida]|uniref:CCHC-type domain-containing protein n=1 Tax=Rotaria sordida TaxID=392033 RepID=A0A818RTX4_9BILA|nr:unnamed protein product [Rotaria sordida]CAF3656430.1 unnamed protein product [Rotaria sordida]
MQKLRTNYARVTFSSTERIKLFAIHQESSQTLTDFANSLRDKSVTCKFPNDFYEDALITAFVGGLKNEHVRKHLMQQNLETFEQTLNTARIFESVLIQGANVKDDSSEETSVMAIEKHNKQNKNVHPKSICSSCGSTDHPRSKCRFRHVTCHKCNKEGHIAKVCRSQITSNNYKVNTIFSVTHEQVTGDHPIRILIQTDRLQVQFELDTGSPVTVINGHTWNKMGKPDLQPVKSTYNSFSGHSIRLKEEKMVKVKYNGQSTQLQLLVRDGHRNNILGRNWINALQLNKIPLGKIDIKSRHVNVNHEMKKLKNMMIHYSNIFKDTSWNLKQQLKDVQDLLRSIIITTSNKEHSFNQDKVYIDDFHGALTKVKSTPENLIYRNDNQIQSSQWLDNKDVIIDDNVKSQLEHETCSAIPQHHSSDQDTRTFQRSSGHKKKK